MKMLDPNSIRTGRIAGGTVGMDILSKARQRIASGNSG
jgi:hypothetical protein